jgi:hypothetical protein
MNWIENGLVPNRDGEWINTKYSYKLQAKSPKVNDKASPITITLLMDLIESNRYKWIMDEKVLARIMDWKKLSTKDEWY